MDSRNRSGGTACSHTGTLTAPTDQSQEPIFTPGVAAFGAAKYYELIFERERAEDATAAIGASSGHVGSPAGA